MKTVALSLVAAGLVLVGLDYALALPDVLVSYQTNTCVDVITYQGAFFDSLGYSCENMPAKYNHIWVN